MKAQKRTISLIVLICLCTTEAAIVDTLINLIMDPSSATLIPFLGDSPWYFVSPWVASIIYLVSYDMYMDDKESLDAAGLDQDFMFSMAFGSMEDAYEDVWGKRFKPAAPFTSTIGADGVMDYTDGLGGPAPCLENYISVIGNSITGEYDNKQAVHGIEANDGAFVAVGYGRESSASYTAGFVIKGSSGCTHTNVYSTFTSTESGATATCENYAWIATLSEANGYTRANWVAQSPDNTYFAVAGIEEQTNGVLRIALWKINAADGVVVWKMNSGATGSDSGLQTVYFSSDGGIVVGGYINANEPYIAKVDATDAAGSVAPTSFVWEHTVTDAAYEGITKSMRLDSSDNIYAIIGSEPTIIKLAGSDGTVAWTSPTIGTTEDIIDIELITSTGGLIVVGNYQNKGAMIELDSTGTLVWGPTLYGNYPGGVNQFAGLDVGNDEEIDTVCFGVTTTTDSSGTITGYAMACETYETYNSTSDDPRQTKRALTVATDLTGQRVWSRQDSYQTGTQTSHATVGDSSSKYIFPVTGGKMAFVSEEWTDGENIGFGFGVIKVADGNKCTETLDNILPA